VGNSILFTKRGNENFELPNLTSSTIKKLEAKSSMERRNDVMLYSNRNQIIEQFMTQSNQTPLPLKRPKTRSNM
jgi:hypothetical protein